MTIKAHIDADLKTALLAGDKSTVTVLRGLKGAILNVEIEKGQRDTGLSDAEAQVVLAREAKRRQESADLYRQGGSPERVEAELAEKVIIERYLPQQLSDEDLLAVVETVIAETKATGPQAMGQVIGAVKQKTAGQADGGRIAALVKEKLA